VTCTEIKTTPQHPIGSGFGAATTAAEVTYGIDLSGKTAIVTGGYSGIGLETTRTYRDRAWGFYRGSPEG
jgi:hypothetical protein